MTASVGILARAAGCWFTLAAVLAGGCGPNGPNPDVNGKPLDEWLSDLSSPDLNLRRGASLALAATPQQAHERIIAPLVDSLDDPDTVVRTYACQTLAGVGVLAGPALEAALSSRSVRQRVGAAVAMLGFTPDNERAFEVALEAATLEAQVARGYANLPTMERLAEKHLVAGGAKAVSMVIPAVEHENPNVRMMAVAVLLEIGPPDATPALPALEKALRDKYEPVQDAVRANIHKFRPDGRREPPRSKSGHRKQSAE